MFTRSFICLRHAPPLVQWLWLGKGCAARREPALLQKCDLFRLGKKICPGFPTRNTKPGQKGVFFCPGSGNRDKKTTFCPGWYTSATCLVHPFVPVGVTNRDKRSIFSSYFSFLNSFSISIKLMYWNSVCKISTNIHTHIYI